MPEKDFSEKGKTPLPFSALSTLYYGVEGKRSTYMKGVGSMKMPFGTPHKKVRKNKDGMILSVYLDLTRRVWLDACESQGHLVIWGPLCRSMKRPPQGRENVCLICKTCGEYIEAVPE